MARLYHVLVPEGQSQPESLGQLVDQQLWLVPDEEYVRVSQEQRTPIVACPTTTAATAHHQWPAEELVLPATPRAHAEQCSVAESAPSRAECNADAAATTTAAEVNPNALSVVFAHSQFGRGPSPVTWKWQWRWRWWWSTETSVDVRYASVVVEWE